jgi:hypothetical protein
VDPVGLLSFLSSATTYESLEGGRIRPYAVISWPAITQTEVLQGGQLRLKWRGLADTVMQEISPIDPTATAVKVYGIGPGQKIIAHMVAVNAIGAVSPISIGAFTVASDLPSSEVKASGNLLSFSTLVDTNGLIVAKDAGATDAITVVKSSFGMNDTPGSVLLQQIGRQQINSYLDFPPVPVEPGQAYAGYASLTNARCASDVRLNFLNEAGALVSEHASSLCTNSRTSAVESGYDQFGVRVVAPTTAAKAVLRIRSTGTDLADVGNLGSGTYVLKPFIGPIASVTAAYPIWNAGAASSTRTQDLAIGAATGLISMKAAGPVPFGYVLDSGGSPVLLTAPIHEAVYANDSTEDREVVATASASYTAYKLWSSASFVWAYVVIVERWNGASLIDSHGTDGILSPGEGVSQYSTIEDSFIVPAGQTHTFKFRIVVNRGYLGNAYSTRLKLEIIKR